MYSTIKTQIQSEFSDLKNFHCLPLVLTNQDLMNEFQISASTLNRLITNGDFPPCWNGIRGHYLREKVLDWIQECDSDDYHEKIRYFRSL
ncbi:helix-turn-helix domain-containing protein [Candidatus Enterococcus leclercqii]|uniref:helix-turn-helix domain-containing protein n=1 Tax=Enterococcus TaxID=1350 RepID=UPI003B21EF4B